MIFRGFVLFLLHLQEVDVCQGINEADDQGNDQDEKIRPIANYLFKHND